MNATTEIDKAGRLVIPKRMRDALHLVPGTRVTFCQKGESILISADAPAKGLYMDRGTLVYDAGPAPDSDVLQWIAEVRDARLSDLAAPRSR